MSRRGDNIRKRKDGRWEGRYIIRRDLYGKAVYKSVYAKSYYEVRDKLKNISINNNDLIPQSDQIVNNVALHWLAYIKKYKKHSTYIKYEYIYTHHIQQYIGNKLISEINEDLCSAIIEDKFINYNESCILSNSTIYSIKNVLTQIIKYGTKNTNFKIHLKRNNINIEKKFENTQIFSKIDEQKIINYLLTNINNYNLGILICIFTGIRLGEICALRCDNIDIKNRIIKITQTVQRIKSLNDNTKTELIISSPKTNNSFRIVPICDVLYKILEEYLPKSIYVVSGDKAMEPRTYQYYFEKILKVLSVEYKNFHCIRHTFATNCINGGMDVKCLSEILGHSDVKTTLNRYVHPSIEQKINQINSLLSNYGLNKI